MVSADEFYKQTNKNFATVFEKIDDVQKEVTNLKSAYDSHIAVGKALDKAKKISTRQKLGIFLGLTPVIIALYAIFS